MKIESGKNRLILARAGPHRHRATVGTCVLGEKEGRRWGLGGRFSEPMDIDQGTVVRPRIPLPPIPFRPVPSCMSPWWMRDYSGRDTRWHPMMYHRNHRLVAQLLTAPNGVQAASVSKEMKKGRSPSPTPLGQWSLHTLSTTLRFASIVPIALYPWRFVTVYSWCVCQIINNKTFMYIICRDQ